MRVPNEKYPELALESNDVCEACSTHAIRLLREARKPNPFGTIIIHDGPIEGPFSDKARKPEVNSFTTTRADNPDASGIDKYDPPDVVKEMWKERAGLATPAVLCGPGTGPVEACECRYCVKHFEKERAREGKSAYGN